MAVATTYPRLLTMEEYDQNWKPQGWNLIIIGPTSTWRQDWKEWEAIRDIVQNALDEAESYSFGYDEEGLWIMDNGSGIAVEDFLLGPPKLKPDWARGRFGEGMKIGALALLRQGYTVHIKTVGRELWIIFLAQKVDSGKVDTLAALWRPSTRRRGTEFHIIGYSGPAFERYFVVNLPRSIILAQVVSPLKGPKLRYNQLIKGVETMAASPQGGVIYSRDIYLKDINSQFSYNLWGFELAPDRHGPKDESEMHRDMGRLWAGVKDVTLLESFLKMMTDPPIHRTYESHHVSMDYMGREALYGKHYNEIMLENARFWRKAWQNAVGSNAVMRTTDRWDSMVKHIGYISVNLYYGVRSALKGVIDDDELLVAKSQESLKGVKVVPDNDLTPRALAHLKLAREITQRCISTDIPQVFAAVIPPASDLARTAGMYESATNRVYIALDKLEHFRDTVDVLVHELGHHVAFLRTADPIKMEDLQPEHSTAMTYVASRVFQLTAEKTFDPYLEDVVW
jgi:hypothetical protein